MIVKHTDHEPLFTEGDLISSYSRAQALADGALVAADPAMAEQAGWRLPVAYTAAVRADIEWTERDEERTGIQQDTEGRQWDVLWMGYLAAKRHIARCEADPSLNPSVCRMEVLMVQKHGQRLGAVATEYVLHIGPGDSAEAVLTVMLVGEN